ncbi:MAG TPA: glycosyltransferase family 9 protein [bacterium]|nr:glycosyltransferase family 9 protein [bacterium]
MSQDNHKNALVIRPGSLGDIIATIPVFLSLKNASFNVFLVGKEKVNRYLEHKGIIKKGIDFGDMKLSEYFSRTKKMEIPGFPDFEFVLCYLEPECSFCQNLTLTYGNRTIFHPVSEQIPCHISNFLLIPLITKNIPVCYNYQSVNETPGNIFFIHPGSGSKRKNWPQENFAEVFKTMNKNFDCKILIGECEQEQKNFWIQNAGTHNIVEVQDVVSLAEVLEKGTYFVGNDSGVSHLAAFLGLQCFVIFGPTSPTIWAPRGENVEIIKTSVQCAPCSRKESSNCSTLMCLQEIKIHHTISVIKKHLNL